MGLSVESQMPMDIMLNPKLADEPPLLVDKMESIFVKTGEQAMPKNVKTMDINESEMIETINNKQTPQPDLLNESDLTVMTTEEPAGFTLPVQDLLI
jgi:hypothetical protein